MREYYYLVSSLPMLEFGAKAPLSYEDFLSVCRQELDPSDMKIMERTTIEPSEDIEDSLSTLREWKRFETFLRNELVFHRASKRSKDPYRYTRSEDCRSPFLTPSAHWAVNQDSPFEAERFLDQLRWEKIEELSKGHYFDIDYLVSYSLKLQILGRWQTINSSNGMHLIFGGRSG